MSSKLRLPRHGNGHNCAISTNTINNNQNKNGGGKRQIPLPMVLIVCLASFLAGSMISYAMQVIDSEASTSNAFEMTSLANRFRRQQSDNNNENDAAKSIPIHTPQECLRILKMNNPRKDWTSFEEFVKQEQWQQPKTTKDNQRQPKTTKDNQRQPKRLPKSLVRFVEGMVRIKKADFVNKFDAGIPYDLSNTGEEELLMFYNRRDAMPSNQHAAQQAELGPDDIPLLNTEDATENCQYVRVLNQPKDNYRRCFALVPGYEMMTVQNWMRLGNKPRAPLDETSPFKLASRGRLSSGVDEFDPRRKNFMPMARNLTVNYFTRLDHAHEKLMPLARAAKTAANSVIVMTCNYGQSELLMNFVCAAKLRGLNIDPIILFATDVETYGLSQSLGLKTYYDEDIFKDLPTKSAARYGDTTFSMMMMAKIYCVHMLTSMGYHVLFQDVDMIWYKNPLEFFEDKSLPTFEFDMHFQDDGSRQIRFAPYSANSGFYYIRNNPVTQLFMEDFVMATLSILARKSHQQTMIHLINEHMTLYGLKVKVYSRVDTDYFPGGYHYHMNKQWMRDFLKGNKKDPYIFHMCWTENKSNKLLFLRQMGEWYVQDTCVVTK